jgi:hypothetical protein
VTHCLGVGFHAGREGGESRLQLKPNVPTSTYLDGAWWPRSAQLAVELPVLVEALSDRLCGVAVVGYHRNAWTPAPPQLQIADETVQLQGLTSDEPASVILIGRDSHRVTLLELDAASEDPGGASSANRQAEQVTAQSAAGVAAQLARHEGRADSERTAEIARWCQDSAQQFVHAPIQAFVPILVHHIVRNRDGRNPPCDLTVAVRG